MRESTAYKTTALHRRVMVRTTSGSTFRGILWRQAGPLLELRDVEMVEERRGEVVVTPMDGSVIVERSKVEFVQALPVAGA